MKPTISIYNDEIVITTDSFDLILKTGGEVTERRGDEARGSLREKELSAPDIIEMKRELDRAVDEWVHTVDQQVETKKARKMTPKNIELFLKGEANKGIVNTSIPQPELTSEKHTRNLPAKPCIVCGNDFKPTWHRQHYCPACKKNKAQYQRRKPLAEQSAEELEKTLQEIEDRRKKPYEFK